MEKKSSEIKKKLIMMMIVLLMIGCGKQTDVASGGINLSEVLMEVGDWHLRKGRQQRLMGH